MPAISRKRRLRCLGVQQAVRASSGKDTESSSNSGVVLKNSVSLRRAPARSPGPALPAESSALKASMKTWARLSRRVASFGACSAQILENRDDKSSDAVKNRGERRRRAPASARRCCSPRLKSPVSRAGSMTKYRSTNSANWLARAQPWACGETNSKDRQESSWVALELVQYPKPRETCKMGQAWD